MIAIEQLWSAADLYSTSTGENPRSLFGDLGLFLERPLRRWDYWCTPANTLTFASTGGDGVHYGFLQLDGAAPVVMTVPMTDTPNLVVADDLEEFLSLGFHIGWFSLENLIYRPAEAIEQFSQPDEEMWPEEMASLLFLREQLQFEHRPLSMDRIATLQEQYAAKLNRGGAEWR